MSSGFRKEARSALDDKDFDRALSICEYGLEVDRNDYLLLVFRGVALKNLGEFKKAIESYERATKVEPKQLLAWKGLLEVLNKVSLYERKQELLEKVLFSLREISIDPSDKKLYSSQLIDLFQGSKRFKEAIEGLKEFSKEYNEDVEERLILLWELWEEEEIRGRVEKERFRMSADPIEITSRKITAQVYSES